MNVLNFIDGMDGLAAGIGAISSGTFCVLALSLGRVQPALVVAALAGACIGFLRRNFHPARVFMGDTGSKSRIGFVLASVSVIGVLKTAAAVAVGFPLVVLFVPLLDTSFVIARRLKHGQAPWRADSGHLHHRFARVGRTGASARRRCCCTAGASSLAGFALAIRFVHYRTHGGVRWEALRGARRARPALRSRSRCTWSTCSRSSSSATCTSSACGAAARCRGRRRSSSRAASAGNGSQPVAEIRTNGTMWSHEETARSGIVRRMTRSRSGFGRCHEVAVASGMLSAAAGDGPAA